MATSRETSGVLVLHKTLDILEKIKGSADGVRLADLSRAVAMPKPTVYRILNTLESRGYLDRNGDGNYRVARKLFDVQRSVSIEQALTTVAQPYIVALAAECKETVNLGIMDAGEVVVVQTVESPQAVRMSSKVGNRRHMHATALGKVFLASMPDKDVLRYLRLKGQPVLTPHTIATSAELLKELEKIRKQGFAIDNQENEIEGRCVGAPIHAPDESVVAALSVSGPEFRLDVSRARVFGKRIIEVCKAISKAL